MDVREALDVLRTFCTHDQTRRLSEIEAAVHDCAAGTCEALLSKYSARREMLAAAALVKRHAGQIDVTIHALGILLCLPKLLHADEVIESVSLGAGNTGRRFDLKTSHRVAEFKFIAWKGGSETIRQNSLFKDFYNLAEYASPTPRSRHLYVLGREKPLAFLQGQRSIESVLSRNVSLLRTFTGKYPDCRVVRDYYSLRSNKVSIEDVSTILPELDQPRMPPA